MSERLSIPDAASLRAANINPATLLATDYLNHFNEVLMLIEMLPSMPDCAEDIFAWRPMSYDDYFSQSTFKEKDLASSLYEAVNSGLKTKFEGLVTEINEKVLNLIEQVSAMNGNFDMPHLESLAFTASTEIRPLIDRVSAMINGSDEATDWMLAVDHPTAQDEIDRLFD